VPRKRAQRHVWSETVHEGAALAHKDARAEAQGHVVAEIEDVLPRLGEVEGLHLLANDLREMPGLHASHAVAAGGLDVLHLDEGVGIEERQALHPARGLPQHLHRDDPTHRQAGQREA
jgi:hypothetical protein